MPNSSITPVADPNAMAERLLQRAHNRDGLPEIAVGLIFLFCSGFNYAEVMLPRGSIGFKAAGIAFAFLLPLFWALVRQGR